MLEVLEFDVTPNTEKAVPVGQQADGRLKTFACAVLTGTHRESPIQLPSSEVDDATQDRVLKAKTAGSTMEFPAPHEPSLGDVPSRHFFEGRHDATKIGESCESPTHFPNVEMSVANNVPTPQPLCIPPVTTDEI